MFHVMRLCSYNIRGLGGAAKKQEVRKLIVKQKLDLLCLQETKLENVDSAFCLSL